MPPPKKPEPAATGRARTLALEELRLSEAAPTSIVEFVSRGRCLIIGSEEQVLAFAKQLPDSLTVVIAIPGSGKARPHRIEGFLAVRGGSVSIAGALGHFQVTVDSGDERVELGELIAQPGQLTDLIVDLNARPLLRRGLLPLGYYPAGPDPAAWRETLSLLPEMRGEFEKPKFYNYDPEICAHGASGKRGCNRCVEACPAEAIVSVGEKVEVNPYLCQGGGACATACPTGAMTYAYPRPGDLLSALRKALMTFREAAGSSPCLLFHDANDQPAAIERLNSDLPDEILPIAVEDVGSLGMETWLACLAYGADAVMILTTDATPAQVVETTQEQLITVRPILAGLGFDEASVQLLNADQSNATRQALSDRPRSPLPTPARFAAPAKDKRGTLRLALNHLATAATELNESVALQQGAPFGEVRVDGTACTLCMSCVSVCPTHALQDGRGEPQLRFREWNCVQCGLCERACPESAIDLRARYLYDSEAREQPRMLHEEPAFCCVSCGKPFATRSMLEKLERKLEGHWMFQSDAQRRRIQMCEDCRVKDVLEASLQK